MTAYYNEIDPFAVLWLRELIRLGAIADGVVDDRSIVDVLPADLRGFTQCHFFAGIGGWSYALRLAGWSDDRQVWTGSPPCQPFSVAGAGKGVDDDRHLAPHWLDLIKGCRPPVIFGEQVDAAVKKDNWVDDLINNLESFNYDTSINIVPACAVGAPHIRKRLWIGAIQNDTTGTHEQTTGNIITPSTTSVQPAMGGRGDSGGENIPESVGVNQEEASGEGGGDTNTSRLERHRKPGKLNDTTRRQESSGLCSETSSDGGMADSECPRREQGAISGHREVESAISKRKTAQSPGVGSDDRMADSECPRREQGADRGWAGREHAEGVEAGREVRDEYRDGGAVCRMAVPNTSGSQQGSEASQTTGYRSATDAESGSDRHQPTNAPLREWDVVDWLFCRDGKWRPVEPGTFPLVDGLPRHMGRGSGLGVEIDMHPSEARTPRIKGYGNAIAPQVASEIIKGVMSYLENKP